MAQIPNIRIDTHRDNAIMQHLLEKNGFVKCGIIYVEDGSPRIAYQKRL
jgi:RimJ/RimL family protein N-acetyltransferase